ncbi:hypothetical protein [Chitinimonas sp.]|uniref:hypothetical protein n=1 Tax=Chitinimonas sp. TaxID=1934313 RepID=UPI0035AE9890
MLGSLMLLASPIAHAYKISMAVVMPKGSAGETLVATQPSSTKFSPCSDKLKVDAFDIQLTFDVLNKNKIADREIYIILYNAENSPKYLLLMSPTIAIQGGPLRAFNTIYDLDQASTIATFPYLPRERNYVGAGTINLFGGGGVTIDGVISGTWQIIAVVGDRLSTKFSLDEPSSWEAWDVATVVFGRPWIGKTLGRTCQ